MLRGSLCLLARGRCGIVGLPNVGKSTMFNALTGGHAEAGNRPFVTIDPNMGSATVVDSRLDALIKIDEHSKAKVIPSKVDLWDIAGLVKGAGAGEGLGNAFLSHIRECNALIHMVRCYEDSSIMHMQGAVDPVSDIVLINNELIMADLQSITKHGGVSKGKKGDPASTLLRKEALGKAEELLLEEKMLSYNRDAFTDEEWRYINDLNLLTLKEMIFVCNIDEDAAASGGSNKHVEAVRAEYGERHTIESISAAIEAEAKHMGDEGSELLEEFGLGKAQAEGVTQSIVRALKLKVFFTAGDKEVRSWQCNEDDTVQSASAAIHSDFPFKTTAVDITPFDDYIASNGDGSKLLKKQSPNTVAADGAVLYYHIDQSIKVRKGQR
eukprot:TRINITY_DN22421_c0_g1_i1.p1 TRINITY_DN22421_c0_g1~~TRINITY_DN22421_c0_g1_i1.p1  ORF type:complete len:382 (+),score=156.79 TRINITY_DN22421_c0_g1_i1:58-1203(+)